MIFATLSLLLAGIVETFQYQKNTNTSTGSGTSPWYVAPQHMFMGASIVFVIPAGILIFITAPKMKFSNETWLTKCQEKPLEIVDWPYFLQKKSFIETRFLCSVCDNIYKICQYVILWYPLVYTWLVQLVAVILFIILKSLSGDWEMLETL